mgnify:CR=1 FL=1
MQITHILRTLLIVVFVLAVFLFEYHLSPDSRADQEPDLTLAFEQLERSGVPFDHEAHQLMYDCGRCHHYTFVDGVPDPDDAPMDDVQCVDCHDLESSPGSTSLVDAFHKQCIGCHEKKKAGPVACGECHSIE